MDDSSQQLKTQNDAEIAIARQEQKNKFELAKLQQQHNQDLARRAQDYNLDAGDKLLKHSRFQTWIGLSIVLIFAISLLAVLYIYKSTPQFGESIVSSLVSLGIGIFGGYSYGKAKSHPHDKKDP